MPPTLVTKIKMKICFQCIWTFFGSSIEEVNSMFTCAKLGLISRRFWLVDCAICTSPEISSLEVIITWCISDIQYDNDNMKRSSNTQPFLIVVFKRREKMITEVPVCYLTKKHPVYADFWNSTWPWPIKTKEASHVWIYK